MGWKEREGEREVKKGKLDIKLEDIDDIRGVKVGGWGGGHPWRGGWGIGDGDGDRMGVVERRRVLRVSRRRGLSR
jgi:hypothetical protein